MMKLLQKYKILIGLIIIALLIIKFIILPKFSDTKSSNGKIISYTVKKQNLKLTQTLSGKIDADEKISLRFATSGKLAWIGVKKGDLVKKYQTIASLDQRDLKKTLQKKLNDYMSTRWNWEQSMADNNVTTGNIYDRPLSDALKRTLEKAQFDLNSAVIDVELQAITLEYSNLISPINGIITSVDIPVTGVNITPASAQFEITNPNSIYLSVLADQNEVIGLSASDSAEIVMDSYPEEKLTGIVTNIDFTPKSGETGTVYEVKVKIPNLNNDLHYRLGMTGDVTFVKNEKNNVLSIPTNLIKSTNGKKTVLKQIGDQKKMTDIKIGNEFDSDTEIISGLDVGDVIYD
jgi:RND family efflux transporter MFP subunit